MELSSISIIIAGGALGLQVIATLRAVSKKHNEDELALKLAKMSEETTKKHNALELKVAVLEERIGNSTEILEKVEEKVDKILSEE